MGDVSVPTIAPSQQHRHTVHGEVQPGHEGSGSPFTVPKLLRSPQALTSTTTAQRRLLRAPNVDAHWCNALERYLKTFLFESLEIIQEMFQLLSRRRERQREQAVQARQRSLDLFRELDLEGSDSESELTFDSELTFEDFDKDAHITDADIKEYLQGDLRIIRKVSCDDKSKVATGEPGRPVETGVSQHSTQI